MGEIPNKPLFSVRLWLAIALVASQVCVCSGFKYQQPRQQPALPNNHL